MNRPEGRRNRETDGEWRRRRSGGTLGKRFLGRFHCWKLAEDFVGAGQLYRFEAVASRSPEEIITNFTETGQTWANGRRLDDDVTFVVMKMKASTGDQSAGAV